MMARKGMREVFVQGQLACLDAVMHWTALQVTVEHLVVERWVAGRWVSGRFLVVRMTVVDTVVADKVVAGMAVACMTAGDKVVVHSTTVRVAAVGPSVVSHRRLAVGQTATSIDFPSP
jgi:hypothetical protein